MLSSINLYNIVDNKFTSVAEINFGKLEALVRLGINVLDETLDYGLELLPLDEQKKCAIDWRAIGLGVFGLADMFVAMGIKYGSKESIELVSRLFDFINAIALDESSNLAHKYGTFAMYDWEKTKESPMIKSLLFNHADVYNKIKEFGLRNGTVLSVAPTGCQKKETIVATEDGLLRLDELVDVNGDKWQERGDITAIQERGTNKILKGYINGYAQTKKIKLYSGIELESTFNHQYRVIRNGTYLWCRADELVVGDIIPSRINYYNKDDYCGITYPKITKYHKNSKDVRFPDVLDEKFAFILGCYFANGSTKKNRRGNYSIIRFAMNAKKENDINKLMDYCYEVFGVRPRISIPKNRATCADVYIASVKLCSLFSVNGLIKGKAYNLHIPKLIRQSPRSVIEAFIDGYYMCDGSSYKNTKYIDTVSYTMAQELAVVFRALGTDIKIYIDNKRTGSLGSRALYRVYFGGRMSIDNKYTANRQRRDTLTQVKEMLGDDFIFDEVIAIEDSTNMTYDIEVENDHYYLANGVVSHNTISLLMGGFSGGVEPLFKLCYERTTHSMEDKGQKFRVFSKSVHDFLEFNNIPFDSDLDELKKQYPFLIESHEVEPLNRVHLQSIMQEYVDNAISSTVNLPNDTSIDAIFKIYMEAWKQGCKGITVFVDGCKRGSILGVTNEKEVEDKVIYDSVTPVSRRTVDEISGVTYRVKTACSDKMYVTINKTSEGDIFEVFVNASGGCVANLSTITRQVSTALRSGIKVEKILKDLSNTQCPACQALRRKGDAEVALSCGNAIADCLRKAYAQQTEPNNEKLLECPECHKKTLKLEAHCCICSNCGYSTCN